MLENVHLFEGICLKKKLTKNLRIQILTLSLLPKMSKIISMKKKVSEMTPFLLLEQKP